MSQPNLKTELTRLGLDPLSRAKGVIDLIERCKSGIIQEKVNVRSEDGFTSVVEKYPDIELRCWAELGKIYDSVDDSSNDQQLVIEIRRVGTVDILEASE